MKLIHAGGRKFGYFALRKASTSGLLIYEKTRHEAQMRAWGDQRETANLGRVGQSKRKQWTKPFRELQNSSRDDTKPTLGQVHTQMAGQPISVLPL